jgi:hypothetical protein
VAAGASPVDGGLASTALIGSGSVVALGITTGAASTFTGAGWLGWRAIPRTTATARIPAAPRMYKPVRFFFCGRPKALRRAQRKPAPHRRRGERQARQGVRRDHRAERPARLRERARRGPPY